MQRSSTIIRSVLLEPERSSAIAERINIYQYGNSPVVEVLLVYCLRLGSPELRQSDL
jgi:hypothetical protein